MPSSLPVEILDYILDYLDADHPSLLACCLLSTSWRACAQPHLFRLVNICKHHVAALLPEALAAVPYLAAHIRAVRAPILLDSACHAVFAHGPFHHVTDLRLSFADWSKSAMLINDDVPVMHLGAAFPAVRALTIDTVSFSCLPILAYLLSVFPDAPYLHLRSLHIKHTLGIAERHMPPPAVTTLILEDCDPCVNTLWMGDGALLLRRLVVQDSHYRFAAEYAAALAVRAANTLVELEIKIPRLCDLEAFSHTYTASPGALCSLRLHVRVNDPPVDLVDVVRLARDIAPDEHTRIALTIAGWSIWDEWSAVRDAPFVWTCANLSARLMYEGAEALEMLGITLPGVS